MGTLRLHRGLIRSFLGLGDILRSHTNPPTPNTATGAPTLLHEAGGATFDLPGLDMKSNTNDGEKHGSFSNVQQFFKSDPLSALISLPLLGETGLARVLGTPNLRSFSVPDTSKAGSARPTKTRMFRSGRCSAPTSLSWKP